MAKYSWPSIYLVRPVLYVAALLFSWWFTAAILYANWTGHSVQYYESFRPVAFKGLTKAPTGISYIVESTPGLGRCTVTVIQESPGEKRPEIREIWTAESRLYNQAYFRDPIKVRELGLDTHMPNTAALSQLPEKGVYLSLEIKQELLDPASGLESKHVIPLVEIRPLPSAFGHNFDVEMKRSAGPLGAELGAVATSLSKQKAAKLPAEKAVEIAAGTTSRIAQCSRIASWGDHDTWFLRLVSGPIEQLIITLSVFCIAVFALELGLAVFRRSTVKFAIDSADLIIDLVPYVGFFGTIYGMGQALLVLGQIDISNSLQKATEIGPITGNISLAMKTSQLGIVFFLLASLVTRIMRIVIKYPK